jgi:hypothetical protein
MRYDKRKLERLDIFLMVEFKPLQSMGGGTTGITIDLTTAGFSMEAQSIDCKVGDIFEFRLKHPSGHQELILSGEVVWKNHSWYKYVIGVKFLEISKEQRTGILKLMSGVKDVTTAAGLSEEDSSSQPEIEKREEPAVKEDSVKTDDSGLDTSELSSSDIDLEESGHEEPQDREETSIAGDETGEVKVGSSVPYAAEVIHDDVSSAEEGRKKKAWLYVPLAAAVIVILLIALPSMIENFDHMSKSRDARLSGSESHGTYGNPLSIPEADSMKGGAEYLLLPAPVPVRDVYRDISIGKDLMENVSGDMSANNRVNSENTEEPALSEENHNTPGTEQKVNEEEDKKNAL